MEPFGRDSGKLVWIHDLEQEDAEPVLAQRALSPHWRRLVQSSVAAGERSDERARDALLVPVTDPLRAQEASTSGDRSDGTQLVHNTASVDEATLTALQTLELRRELGQAFRSLRSAVTERGFQRVLITNEVELNADERRVCALLRNAIALREKYLYLPEVPEYANPAPPYRDCDLSIHVPPPYDPFRGPALAKGDYAFEVRDGIMEVTRPATETSREPCKFVVPGSYALFVHDLNTLIGIMNDPDSRSFCYRRLQLLSLRFQMHLLLNDEAERLEQMTVPHRDFYNVRKVDTHIHHSSCMNQKHLLRFIKKKLKTEPNTPVIERDGRVLTLAGVFDSLGITAYELSVDTLDVHADKRTVQRFDRFNNKYSPLGESRLREVFLKTDNFIEGRFLAEITREVLDDLVESKYSHIEPRISIYGKKRCEWDRLARWFTKHRIYSDHARWLIQIPRLFGAYHEAGLLESFQEMLNNIFFPLFEVTQDPSTHPELHTVLQQIVGFDTVDDESVPQPRIDLLTLPPPLAWRTSAPMPYAYFTYYIYANLWVLNRFREHRGLHTFRFRPHAGEAGEIDHLAVTFLLAHGINHGINLKKAPVLQYLYYLCQVGLAVSPLGNNLLFVDYTKSPVPVFIARGLNVSLSTDDPLMFHFSREPLMEEYSVAAQIWKLSSSDLCELARNSALQSGFEPCVKAHWLGPRWFLTNDQGNDIHKSNVPSIRVRYRYETLLNELTLVFRQASGASCTHPEPGGSLSSMFSSRVLPTFAQFYYERHMRRQGPAENH
jgi:AMP deaminase